MLLFFFTELGSKLSLLSVYYEGVFQEKSHCHSGLIHIWYMHCKCIHFSNIGHISVNCTIEILILIGYHSLYIMHGFEKNVFMKCHRHMGFMHKTFLLFQKISVKGSLLIST